jgi:glycosyltransferase involved in cell wall biosynthesis
MSALSENNIDYSSVANISDDEIVREYERSDMLVFVSTYEGFGLPIVEANAVGRPVITSNILSMPEVAGDAACLVDPLNVSEIKDGIRRIITDAHYRKQLVENGYRNAKRFEAAAVAGQYAQLYEEVLKPAHISPVMKGRI